MSTSFLLDLKRDTKNGRRMKQKYYVDTCIWIDLYEDRKGYNGELLGKFAAKFLFSLLKKQQVLIISKLLIKELKKYYAEEQIEGMFRPFTRIIEKMFITKQQADEAKQIAEERKIPAGDALHAILARDYALILVTRDNDFKKMEDIAKYHKPEELI